MAVAIQRAPAGRREAGGHVLAGRQAGRPVDGDPVVVPQHGQPIEAQMACQPDRLVVQALHQAAVAGDRPGAVVDQRVAEARVQMPFRHRHADRHRQPLTQRAGGRLHAIQQEVLRMAGARAAQLAEPAQLVAGRVGIARQVQGRVDQHRPVTSRQHETVAVRPAGRGGVEAQELPPQHGGHVGHAHRHAGMAAVGRLDRVHGQRADGVGAVGETGGHAGSHRPARSTVRESKAERLSCAGPCRATGEHVNRRPAWPTGPPLLHRSS